MEINISGQQFELTPAIKAYVEEKLGKLHQQLDHIIKIHVVLKIEKTHNIAHADLHAKGHDLYAKADAGDMYSAIDLLAEKLLQQARKLKEQF
jgi:putative sigma-54 modulation protein